MCEFIPWRKLKSLKSILYIFLIFSVTFDISSLISSRYNPKTESQHIHTNCSNLYKLKFVIQICVYPQLTEFGACKQI